MATETEIKEWLVTAPTGVAELETLEISHADFTQTHYLVRNKIEGFSGVVESGATVNFIYCPMLVKLPDNKADLDQVIQITLGDLNEVIGAEMDNISPGNTDDPQLIYRSFRSDKYEQLEGPITLKITGVNFVKQGANLTAQAKELNISPTGSIYTYDRFPMLRGFI
ncbi:MAG: DUF1833 family protein [Emcibacter sp.]|nr:DUF1833 family protein [Emcibacter sp.]